jgi:hypothetical protein
MIQKYPTLKIAALCFILPAMPVHGQQALPASHSLHADAAQLIRLSPYFERNDGQMESSVLYQVRGQMYSAFLHRDGATLLLAPEIASASNNARRRPVIHLTFAGANPDAQIVGEDKLSSYSSYFSGHNPAEWHTKTPHFRSVRYRNLYPGIDLVFYIRNGLLEYDFVLAPGAEAESIKMKIDGLPLRLTSSGDLAAGEGSASLTLRKPQAEETGGQAREVAVDYVIREKEVRLNVGSYDHTKTLVIDPALVFASFLTSGFDSCDAISDIAADASGVYVTGVTCANSFPSSPLSPPGPPPTNVNARRAFVTKLDPAGGHVIFTSFIAEAEAPTMAIDSFGAVYLAGTVTNPDAGFPVTSGAYATTLCQHIPFEFENQCRLPYAAKLSPDGATLVYATFLQGASGTPSTTGQALVHPEKITVDDQGALYLTGEAVGQNGTNVLPLQVPVGAFQTTPGFLLALKLNPTGSALQYATYLDGAATGRLTSGIAVDASHAAYITGSAIEGYPTTAGALLPTDPAAGLQSVSSNVATIVTKLSADGSSEIYSTYVDPLGGGPSTVQTLAVDSSGQVIIGGSALSPVPTSCCKQFAGFITKLNATGTAVVYSNQTSISTSGEDAITGINVDGAGAAYGVGFSTVSTTFTLVDPIQGYPLAAGGSDDGVALKLDSTGATQWSTFFGIGQAATLDLKPKASVALDGSGNAYILLSAAGIGATPGSLDPQPPGFPSYMLFKIAPSLGSPVPLIFPGSLTYPATVVGTSSAPSAVRIGNYGDAALSAPLISVTGPFSETDNCSTGAAAGQKCDIAVVFSPTAPGVQTGSLNLNFGTAAPAQTVKLSGTGTSPAVSLSPTSLTFSSQAVNISSPSQNAVITNTGTAPLSILSLQINGDFSQTNGCGPPVAPGGSCTIQVVFTPTALGARAGSLVITDNAPGSPHTLSLSGNGVAANLGLKAGGAGSITIPAGGTASFGFSLGGQGIGGTATLSCSGAPPQATCSVPGTIAFTSTGTTSFTATVATTGRSAALLHPFALSGPATLGLVNMFALVLLPVARQTRRRVKKQFYVPLITLLLLAMLCSCGGEKSAGGGRPQGTPPGTYTLTVAANSGSSTASTTISLTVQ